MRTTPETLTVCRQISDVHLMGQLCMAESFIDPDTYAESEHPGSAYVIEVVAAELLGRDDRAGSRDASAIDANVLGPIRDLAAEATILESFRRQVTAGFWDGPEGAARGRAAAHHLYGRPGPCGGCGDRGTVTWIRRGCTSLSS